MPEESTRLTITASKPAALSVSGELDAHSAPALTEALEAVDVSGRVTVELAGLDFMDSSGLRVLIDTHQRAVDAGGSLVLVNPSRSVERLLAISGLDGHLAIETEG